MWGGGSRLIAEFADNVRQDCIVLRAGGKVRMVGACKKHLPSGANSLLSDGEL